MFPQVLLSLLFLGLITPLAFSSLPAWWALLMAALCLPFIWLSRPIRPAAAFLFGVLWSCTFHHVALLQRLDPNLEQQRLWIEGRITGLPEVTDTGWRFMLADARLMDGGQPLPLMRAHWYAGEPVASGEIWRFETTMRRPRGLSNPGGFDYETWLYAQNIGALASIRAGERVSPGGKVARSLRNSIRDDISAALSRRHLDSQRVLALVVGDRSVLSKADWEVLQATGTSHLMVISGLHVGMLAGTVFLLVTLMGRAGLVHRGWPRLWMAAPPAIVAAGIYTALAGFEVPTQRALLMVILVLVAKLLYRQLNPWVLWLSALCAITLFDPAAPLRAGFWLSFMAVGLLIFGLGGRLAVRGLWAKWGSAQWVIFVGLWPWLLLWGMPGSLTAPAVNAAAIPWVSFLVVPVALLGALLQTLFDFPWLLIAAEHSLAYLFHALAWVAEWQPAARVPFPGWLVWGVGLCGSLALLSPLRSILAVPALGCLLALLTPAHERPQQDELWVTVLDVGQGLAVLLQTRHHSLLYDAGARLHSGFDMGEAVVLPALAALGVKDLDVMLLSHADMDHAGGAGAIGKELKIARVLAGQHEDIDPILGATACTPGDHWRWDGINFDVLYSAPSPAPSNERSCVLRVVAGEGRGGVLLTGDLGIRGEYQLLLHKIEADLLLAPHHGSRSSSSYALIRAVKPQWVAFSAGHNNRFNHPHPKVVERYRELEVEPVYTAGSGAVRFIFDAKGSSEIGWLWRERVRRFWHE